jgi:hypothetical protein
LRNPETGSNQFDMLYRFFPVLLLVSVSAFADCNPAIRPETELLITDLSVVNGPEATQPNGAWTFGHLIRNLAPRDINPADFLETWLKTWTQNQTVDGFSVPARPTIQALIDRWKRTADGKLSLDEVPMRLLAITNRLDVVNGPAGEGRLIFGVLDQNQQPLPFTVIFEYLLPVTDTLDARGWGMRWHGLSQFAFGPEYNAALVKVTEGFVAGQIPETFRHRMHLLGHGTLSQVRTNEIALGSSWELREFTLGISGLLVASPTKQTPDDSFNLNEQNAKVLENWIAENSDAIRRGVHVVPAAIIGGSVHAPMSWLDPMKTDPDPILQEARKHFALQTCNGCHTTETQTSFVHVANRAANQPSMISAFLRDDLQRRVLNLKELVCASAQARVARRYRSTRVH